MHPDFELDRGAVKASPAPTGLRWHMSVGRLMKLIFALGCLFALISALLPQVSDRGNWEPARRAQCANNLKQIGLALHAYHQQYGVLPPAYVADASGRPMHSWRVLLLPFLEQQSLYNKYDFREPWDGPHNIKLLENTPLCYICPSRLSYPTNLTSYAAITGLGTMFPGATPVKFADVTDGLSETLMVVEVANVNIPWAAPLDLDARTMSLRINDPERPGISSKHFQSAHVLFGDSRTGLWGGPTHLPRSRFTIAGGEWEWPSETDESAKSK